MTDEVLPELREYGPTLSTDEVGHVLGMNRAVVQRHIRTHQLPGFRAGGQWRMRRADLQDLMTGNWHPASSAPEDPSPDDRDDRDGAGDSDRVAEGGSSS